MKKKLVISMIALVLCGVFIFTACAPLSDGEGLKEKIESWFGQEDDKSDSDDTTKAPQDSGTVTTVPGDTTGDVVTTEVVQSVPIYTHASENFTVGYVADARQGHYYIYFGFSEGFEYRGSYRIAWDCDVDLLTDHGMDAPPVLGSSNMYGVHYFMSLNDGEYDQVWYPDVYGGTSNVAAFKYTAQSSSITIPSQYASDGGGIYVSAWIGASTLTESELSALVALLEQHIVVTVYELS